MGKKEGCDKFRVFFLCLLSVCLLSVCLLSSCGVVVVLLWCVCVFVCVCVCLCVVCDWKNLEEMTVTTGVLIRGSRAQVQLGAESQLRHLLLMSVRQRRSPGLRYHAARNKFERFREFLESTSRFEFDVRRCGNYNLRVYVQNVPVCTGTTPTC